MSMSIGLPFSWRRVVGYVVAALLVLIANECYARHVGAEIAEVERTSRLALQAARQFRSSLDRYRAAAAKARESVAVATTARARVRVLGPKTLEVVGSPVPVVVPPAIVELIVRQDEAIARLSAALLQADATLSKGQVALSAAEAHSTALRRRIPRFGFRSGLVVGAGVVALLAHLIG